MKRAALLDNPSGCHASHTDLSRYLVDRMRQALDESEPLTYRAPATNGYVLLAEVEFISGLVLEHSKSETRLAALLRELSAKEVKSSVEQDPILSAHFQAVQREAISWGDMRFSGKTSSIRVMAGQYVEELATSYYAQGMALLTAVDYQHAPFDRNAEQLYNVITALVSQLLFRGYSVSHLRQLNAEMAKLPLDLFLNPLKQLTEVDADSSYRARIVTEQASYALLLPDSLLLDEQAEEEVPPNTYEFACRGRDPYSAVASALNRAYRRAHLTQTDIRFDQLTDIALTSKFLDVNDSEGKYRDAGPLVLEDPLLGFSRPNTLKRVLEQHGTGLAQLSETLFTELEEPLYYYNQSRSAPSADSAYGLLWTALESMIAYKTQSSELESIKDSISPLFSLGAVTRSVYSTARLLWAGRERFAWSPILPAEDPNDPANLRIWTEWLITPLTVRNPFNDIKAHPLTCRQFGLVNKQFQKVGGVLQRIRSSETTMNFQLDRLYQMRNRIVHQGDSDNSLLHLITHLEYYVGALLAQAIIEGSAYPLSGKYTFWEWLFGRLRSKSNSTYMYLSRNEGADFTITHCDASGILHYKAFSR